MSQLKLALTRDPRITPVKTSTKQSFHTESEEKKVKVTPSKGVVSLVGGAKNPPQPHAQLVSPKISKSTALTQTHLMSGKPKIVPAIPRLKPDSVLPGKGQFSLGSGSASSLSLANIQLQQQKQQRQQQWGESQLEHQSSSTLLPVPAHSKLPPPLVKVPFKIQTKKSPQTETKIAISAPSLVVRSPPSLISANTALHGLPSTDNLFAEEDQDLLPKAKRAKSMKTALLPMSRIKTIMKTNIQSTQTSPQLSQDSVLIITKATVRFSTRIVLISCTCN